MSNLKMAQEFMENLHQLPAEGKQELIRYVTFLKGQYSGADALIIDRFARALSNANGG